MSDTEPIRVPRSGGEVLARFRRHHGVSQQGLTAQCHASKSKIAQVEHGVRQPSPALLRTMSRTLQLSEVERAMLCVAYDKVDGEQESMLPYVRAVLRLDPLLTSEQADRLVRVVEHAYRSVAGCALPRSFAELTERFVSDKGF